MSRCPPLDPRLDTYDLVIVVCRDHEQPLLQAKGACCAAVTCLVLYVLRMWDFKISYVYVGSLFFVSTGGHAVHASRVCAVFIFRIA